MTEWTRHTPWRQGHLLPEVAAKAIAEMNSRRWNQSTVVIVATHDCDLAQLPDKEPNVEVIFGRRIEKLDGCSTHAKSSRTLHIEVEGDERLLAEFIITEKVTVPKTVLVDFKPDESFTLSTSQLTTFQLWLASRYRRSAFPDEFERRLSTTKLAEKISKAVKPHGVLITAVFFDVDEGRDVTRTGPDDIYTLDIYLLHAVEPDFTAAEAAATNAKAAIREAFSKNLLNPKMKTWQHIELRYCEVLSEESLTYYQSKFLKKWRLDHLSLGAEPQQPVIEA